jgi:kumamolisin
LTRLASGSGLLTASIAIGLVTALPASALQLVSEQFVGGSADAGRNGLASPHTGLGRVRRRTIMLLSLRHEAGLAAFARAVSDPASKRYRQYGTVSELDHRFGASRATRALVVNWLRTHGGSGHIVGNIVVARVPAGLLSRGVPRALRGAVTSVSSPPRLRVRPLLTPAGDLGSGLPRTGTPRGCAQGTNAGRGGSFAGYAPNQLVAAYGHAVMHARGLRGQGQRVALVEIDGFSSSDVNGFATCFGLPRLPITVHGPLQPAAGETDLDLEMLTGAAPRLAGVDVYENPPSAIGILTGLEQAVHDRRGHVAAISISLGLCEAQTAGASGVLQAMDDALGIAAGARISAVVASGDSGAASCRIGGPPNPNDPLAETTLAVESANFPASSPYALAVGGTSIALSSSNRLGHQSVWNDLPFALRAGGGGPSLFEARPWWQLGAAPRSIASGVTRLIPDVAAFGDDIPGIAIRCTTAPVCRQLPAQSPGWVTVGGTSADAPLYAAGAALLDQDARRHGQRPIGLLDPLLYSLAQRRARGLLFDVVKGNNDTGPATVPDGTRFGCCSARRGYDQASGWGSLDVAVFDRLALGAGRSGSRKP